MKSEIVECKEWLLPAWSIGNAVPFIVIYKMRKKPFQNCIALLTRHKKASTDMQNRVAEVLSQSWRCCVHYMLMLLDCKQKLFHKYKSFYILVHRYGTKPEKWAASNFWDEHCTMTCKESSLTSEGDFEISSIAHQFRSCSFTSPNILKIF